MGVIPISTPIRKIDNPMIIKNAPMINRINTGVSSGVAVKFNTNTIIVMGRTDNKTSFNFSVIMFKYDHFLSGTWLKSKREI